MITPRTMSGVLELLPGHQVLFQGFVDTIRRAYELYGFVPIDTPVMELTDILLTKTGGETERQVYLAQSSGSFDQDEKPDLALRFDLTVPLARYVAEHQHELVFPFRRYQIQKVYRGESAQRGRFREFYQCDIDIVGREHLDVGRDAEIPAVISEVFDLLDLGPFTIRINNRKLMRGFLNEVGVTEPHLQTLVLREVDKLDKKTEGEVASAIRGIGLTLADVDQLIGRMSVRFGGADAAEGLTRVEARSALTEEGLGELSTVVSTMRGLGVPDDRFMVDFGVARGLDYYTGTVYETVLDDYPAVGSVCSGGRYDDLASHYTTSALPGVGMSIGLTRLFWQLLEAGRIGDRPVTTVALVTMMDEGGFSQCLRIAKVLREAGIPTESAVAPGKLAKQLRYADRAGIRFAVIAGENERSRGVVTVRDLSTQSQDEMPDDELVGYLDQRRGRR